MASEPPAWMNAAATERAALSQLLKNPITWSDGFLINVPAVDDQHKKLFYLAERLRQVLFEKKAHEAPIVGRDLKPIQVVLHWLVQYCKVHFELEEKVQLIVGNPELPGHKEKHDQFAHDCELIYCEVSNSMVLGKSVDIAPIFQKVLDWLVNHVCGMDKNIGLWCEQQGVDCSIPQLQDMTDGIPVDLPDLSPQELSMRLRRTSDRYAPY